MADSNQEKLDQSSSKEDSTAMTVEFLRARLLYERSVSKNERQRADELEKRVEELEEQLRIVSLQRKMAEKATVDVLSILESRGISETSETFDSGSDHETHRESHEGNEYPNGEDRSVVSKQRSGSEELSGSDLDSSQVNGRSLSWKGHTDSQRSREKIRDPLVRRRGAFSLIGSSSPKHHLGKSCRQNRRKDTRLAVEERKTEPVKFVPQENGVVASLEGVVEFPDSAHEIAREASGSVANGRTVDSQLDDVSGHHHVHGKDTEKALEDRAQLIGQYEEMEKAQREWEEKFRQNNNGTPDPYDHRNHSDITEERDEGKAQTPSNVGTYISETEAAKEEEPNGSIEPPKLQANGFSPPPSHGDTRHPMDRRFQPQEFEFPTAKGAESPPRLQNHGPSSETGSSSHKADHSPTSQSDLYALVPHNPPNPLGSVLDALRQAKLQLHRKMSQSQLGSAAPTPVPEPVRSLPFGSRVSERSEISVGYAAGLFRLPTDFSVEEMESRAGNFLGAAGSTTPDRSPSGFPRDERFLTGSSTVSGSRASSSLNYLRFDSFADSGISPASRYNHYSPQTFQDLMPVMPRMPSDEGFRRSFPSGRVAFGMPEDRISFYDDHGRPNNMYR